MASEQSSISGDAAIYPGPKRSRRQTVLVLVCRFCILVLLGFLSMVYLLQDRLIFPGTSTQGSLEATVHPRSGAELLRLETARGQRVTALYGPAFDPAGHPDPDAKSQPALVYFYGNAMCLAYAQAEFERFRRLGLNVLIPDYLGYGLSGGRASEIGCRETADAAYQALLARGFAPCADHCLRLVAGWSRRD